MIAHQDVSLETGNGNQSNDHLPDRPTPIVQTRNILTELSELGTNTTLAASCFVSVDTIPHYPKLGTPTAIVGLPNFIDSGSEFLDRAELTGLMLSPTDSLESIRSGSPRVAGRS